MDVQPGPPPPSTAAAPDHTDRVLHLLRRAGVAAVGALAVSVVLEIAFLWAINPTNLGYSGMVVFQNGWLVVLWVLGWALPIVTFGGAQQALRLASSGQWAPMRRLLPFLVGTGYASWIVPGHYLLETLNLVNAWAVPKPRPPMARSVP
jgi:hypothetical protein